MNSSYVSKSKLNISSEGNNNERMVKLADKLSQITNQIQNEKSSKFDQYEQKSMNLYNIIESNKEQNNTKFNEIKEQILVIQKTLEDDASKREQAHNDFMDFMQKMEDKIFEKFDSELSAKKEIEVKVAQYLEEKFNNIGLELQNQSKIRYDAVENLENYFEKELPKIQSGFKIEQNEREDGDNNILIKLSDYFTKYPTYNGTPKEFPSKTKKPLQLTTKAYLVQKIDRKSIEDLPPKEQMIDFNKFLLQFNSIDEIKNLTPIDLFDIDSELLEQLKEKCRNFTDAAAKISEEKEKQGQMEEAKNDQEFMQYLMNQYIELQNNSINVDIAINTIDKIKNLQYNAEGVKVFFKN